MNIIKIVMTLGCLLNMNSFAMQKNSLFDAAQSGDEIQAAAIIECARAAGRLKEVVEERDMVGWTPLHMASCRGQIGIIRLLLKNEANVNAVDQCQSTPLHEVAYSKHLPVAVAIEIVNMLAAAGANVNARDGMKWTPLYLAATRQEGLPIVVALGKLKAEDKRRNSNTIIHFIALSANFGHRSEMLSECPIK